MLKSPQKAAVGQEKHLKALMRKMKELQPNNPRETPELLKEFELFFSAKKEGAVDVNQSLDISDPCVIEIMPGKVIVNPVFAAVLLGYTGLLEIFLRYGANLLLRNSKNFSLAFLAIITNKLNTLKWLLDKVGYEKFNESLFRHAISEGNLEAVRVIVEHPSFDIAIHEDKEISSLTYATMLTQDDIVRYLLEKGAKYLNYNGHSPYDYAVSCIIFDIERTNFPNPKNLPRKNALNAMQALLESGNVNASVVTLPLEPKKRSYIWNIRSDWKLWDFVQGSNSAALTKTQVAVRLWLTHGAGLCFQYVPGEVKRAFKAPDDTEIIVLAKDNVAYYKISTLTAAIRAEPQRFYLQSLLNVCLAERDKLPQLTPLLQVIQEANRSRQNLQVTNIDRSHMHLFVESLNQYCPYKAEKNRSFQGGSERAEKLFVSLQEEIKEQVVRTMKKMEKFSDYDPISLGEEYLNLLDTLCHTVYLMGVQRKIYVDMKLPAPVIIALKAWIDVKLITLMVCLNLLASISIQLLKSDVITRSMREAYIPLMQAIVRCLLYFEKRLKGLNLESSQFAKIDTLLAITSTLILSSQVKIEDRQLYFKVCQRILKVDKDVFGEAHAEFVVASKLKGYVLLAENHIESGYFAIAKQHLRWVLSHPNFKSMNSDLQAACVRYMKYYLARQNFRMVDEVRVPYTVFVQSCQKVDKNKMCRETEATVQVFQQAVVNKLLSLRKNILPIENCVIAINEKEKTLEISSSKLDNRIINLLRERYPYEMTVEKNENNSLLKCHNIHWVFEDDLFALLALLQVELRQAMNETQNLQETANKSDNASPPSYSLSESFMAMSLYTPSYRSLYSRAPQKRVKVISILDNKEQAPIEENPVLSSETVNRLLQMPRPGLSPLIMIRSDNGGFPDNTHFLCIKESEEFETFLKTLRSRDEHVAYSIPEKGLGQRGVKISHDHQEARVKIYGDARAVGNCTSVIDPETGCTLRLYVVDRIETHKERARAKKHGVKV